MKLLTVATKSEGYFPILIESCKRYNIDIEVLGWGQKWTGFMMKFNLLLEYMKDLDDNEIVCIIDGYDTAVTQPLDVLESKFRKMNCPIVVAEDSTWILHKTIGYMFFGLCKDKTINAGTYIGYVKYLRNMITDICSIFDCKNVKLDDQQILTTYCKKNNICIDTKNELFQVVFYIKLDNEYNGKACIVHGPGATNMNTLLNKLGYDTSNIKLERFKRFISFITHFFYIIAIIILILIVFVWTIFKLFNKYKK